MNDNISAPLIGNQIHALRKLRGLSLQALAERAGTSAPALHRYENGWDRFEIATLRRIAAALGAQLEVRLLAQQDESGRPESRQFMEQVTPLFWDRKLSEADLHAHPRWVLGRVLMYGDLEQARAARSFYGDAAVLDAVAQRGVDERTRAYWTKLLKPD